MVTFEIIYFLGLNQNFLQDSLEISIDEMIPEPLLTSTGINKIN